MYKDLKFKISYCHNSQIKIGKYRHPIQYDRYAKLIFEDSLYGIIIFQNKTSPYN